MSARKVVLDPSEGRNEDAPPKRQWILMEMMYSCQSRRGASGEGWHTQIEVLVWTGERARAQSVFDGLGDDIMEHWVWDTY